ncbi:heavy-metal-associated domain-containing protein [Alkalihalobacillus sp. CinArs1]|uniref:heavy-metal-associated domain-containing protein n=1 Tax=Alkalihalobacillus sp. CinArs1 TaxID=2995314 RepID=UPI0022DE425D|nr:heavy metal-associated domain-containing protein [Alkalihalobacillus sp. CinArs1]
MKETTFVIKGMTSHQCKSSIRSALLDLTGVVAVEVYLDEGKGVVAYDEKEVSVNELTSTIKKRGYEVN